MKQIIFLTGAAATGKTRVMEEIESLEAKNNSNHFTIQKSITREFYKSKGISSEIEIQGFSENDIKTFQFEMLDYYISFTLNNIKENNNSFIVDRSPIDYLSWTLYKCPTMTLNEYAQTLVKVDYFFDQLKDHLVLMTEFKFPTPWFEDKTTSDGFRFDPFTKNKVIAGIVSEEINGLLQRNSSNQNLHYYCCPCIFSFNIGVPTPAQRADLLIQQLQRLFKEKIKRK